MTPLYLRLSGISLATDPFYWPLLSGLTATFIMYFLSTVAHTFQSRSEIAHYVFFMCDYAGKSRMTWVTLMKLMKSRLICFSFVYIWQILFQELECTGWRVECCTSFIAVATIFTTRADLFLSRVVFSLESWPAPAIVYLKSCSKSLTRKFVYSGK